MFNLCVACLKASQGNQGSDMWLKDVDLQIDVSTLTKKRPEKINFQAFVSSKITEGNNVQ